MFNIESIGRIESKFKESTDPNIMKKQPSRVIIEPDYQAGLDKIEENNYLKIVFYLHQAEGYDLIGPRRYGGVRGVFASRSPRRPVPIAVTVVKLLAREDNVLEVLGLDAIDGTPVLDIKPYAEEIDNPVIKFADYD